ncbi:YheT family hydrolase [Emcibacter nanhaiensis]|uniref:Alpha/beta fold hydrolase n=1 Tax=Emcibacter nanhaiensis TaxID=1505037 RepID=A0A501PCG7_9PROT|nr:alpha/beta fold hydrolase [Emcibacter nanhaiensis]TPD57761.1 alpha/beta fold hydrolase [Emcibacter nanhaiensis]
MSASSGYRLLGKTPEGLDIPDFVGSKQWGGADLQTMRNTILGPPLTLRKAGERLLFDIDGGQKLAGALHTEDETGAPLEKKLVIMIHGIAGSEEASPMVSAAAYLISQGFPVLRLNLRGCGESAKTSHGPYHAGLTEDLVAVLAQLPEKYRDQGVFAYAASLGGNMLLKYLGETGEDSCVTAAVAVSAPLDLAACEQKLMEKRNSLYHGYILHGLKNQANLNLAREGYPEAVTNAALTAETIYEFDDKYVSVIHSLGGADNYYASQSCGQFLDAICRPTLLIEAENDPWVPVQSYEERDWPEDRDITALITSDGGHLGFHTQDNKIPWHERIAALFFESHLS